jgi:heterotetrameric sarcosine oxidase delta subunit
MLLIACPFCGPRNESEFAYGGPAAAPRPDPDAVGDAAWVEWLTVPPNPMGPVDERWWHVRGCGRWLTVTRDTMTHAVTGVRDGA